MTGEEKLIATYKNIIRPEMKASWEANYKSWFVVTDKPEDIRYPGKLKSEFSFTSGRFIGLMPKTYFGKNFPFELILKWFQVSISKMIQSKWGVKVSFILFLSFCIDKHCNNLLRSSTPLTTGT